MASSASPATARSNPLRRALSSMNCKVTRFCCCSLRAGIIFNAVLAIINAGLAFGGSVSIYSGFATTIVTSSAGEYLPPGTKIESSAGVHGALATIGVYNLLTAIFGFLAAFRRNQRAATALLIMSFIEVVLSIAIAVISWFAGSSFSVLLAQMPTFAYSIYVLLVVIAYRKELKEGENNGNNSGFTSSSSSSSRFSGGGGGMSKDGDLEAGVDESDLGLDEDGQGAGAGGARGGGQGGRNAKSNHARFEIAGDDDDEDDNDLGRGGSTSVAGAAAAGKVQKITRL